VCVYNMYIHTYIHTYMFVYTQVMGSLSSLHSRMDAFDEKLLSVSADVSQIRDEVMRHRCLYTYLCVYDVCMYVYILKYL